MPPIQAADYSFHTLFEASNIRVDYRGAAARWAHAELLAANELVLIASDQRFKV